MTLTQTPSKPSRSGTGRYRLVGAVLATLAALALPGAGQVAVAVGDIAAPRALTHTRTFSTAASRFEPSSANQGWWSNAVDGQDQSDNYLVGSLECCDSALEFRDYFTFDLRGLTTTVTSATLRVTQEEASSSHPTTLRLSDVSTDAATLNANDGQNPSIFSDLGTGRVYGELTATSVPAGTVVALRLNAAGLEGLNRSRGRFFSVGGSVVGSAAGSNLFSSSTRPATLVVTTSTPRR